MRQATTVLLIGLGSIQFLTPSSAEGQLFKRVKEMATRKVVEAAAERAAKAGDASTRVVDSTVQRGARQFDTAMARAGEEVRTSLGSIGGEPVQTGVDSIAIARISAELSTGRLVVDGLRFTDTDRLDPASATSLRNVARALRGLTGGYLVSVHVAAPSDAQRISDTRSAAVRAMLVAAGFDAGRLFSAGYGTVATVRAERIEILRVK